MANFRFDFESFNWWNDEIMKTEVTSKTPVLIKSGPVVVA